MEDNMSDQYSLTQAGLEEYNNRSSLYDQPVLFHHQKQSSYAQSEGYHSYVSSSDSSSATPFLDKLRQESELLSRQSSHHWSQSDLSSTSNPSSNPCENNSSESTSSTETLKWLGSMSDVSVASHATSSSAISSSVSSSQLIVHSSRVRTPKRHNSESVLYMNDDQISITNEEGSTIGGNTPREKSNSTAAITGTSQQKNLQFTKACSPCESVSQENSITSTTIAPLNSSSSSLNSSFNAQNSSISSIATTSSTVSTNSNPASYRNNSRLFPVNTYIEPVNGNIVTSSSNKTINNYVNHQHHHIHFHHHHYSQQQQAQQQQAQPQQQQRQSSIRKSLPGQADNWQSVAERINDFERQQQQLSSSSVNHNHFHLTNKQQQNQKYTYIDPSKTHKVPNPALKAFQKNAVQSYFERQQQNAKDNGKSSSNKTQTAITNGNINSAANLLRPHSLQPKNSPKEVPTAHARNSLPNQRSPLKSVNDSQRHQQRNETVNNLNSSNNNNITNSDNGKSPGKSITNENVCSTEISNTPPPPPPRSKSLMPAIRRSSSASEYADLRESFLLCKEKQQQQQQMLNNSLNSCSISPVEKIETSTEIIALGSPEKDSFNDCGVPPPPPPPRGRSSMPVRRTSSASEYVAIRDKNLQIARQKFSQHDISAPMIMGPIISLDDWVPERPPKNPNLRIPSPDLPPPPVQPIETDPNLLNQDEPLPPPPPEILRHIRTNNMKSNLIEMISKPPSPSRRNSFAGSPSRKAFYTSSYDSLSITTMSTTNSGISNVGVSLPPPPSIPRKPQGLELMQSRPASSLAQSNKAHKVILNGKLESPSTSSASLSSGFLGNGSAVISHHNNENKPPQMIHHQYFNQSQSHYHYHHHQQSGIVAAATITSPTTLGTPTSVQSLPTIGDHFHIARSVDARVSIRKRSHQNVGQATALMPTQQLQISSSSEAIVANKSPGKMSLPSSNLKSPPPLKPRIHSVPQEKGTSPSMNGKLRCNSKATYLPRQTRDKSNAADPDHGSYKLTLTSSEDSILHYQNSSDISHTDDALTPRKQQCNNLPDVLPLGAKVQQSTSPSSSSNSSPRYGPNSNNLIVNGNRHNHNMIPVGPHTAPALITQNNYPLKSLFNFQSSNANISRQQQQSQSTQSLSGSPPNQSGVAMVNNQSVNNKMNSSGKNTNQAVSPKFMSQSTIDLKKTHIIGNISAENTTVSATTTTTVTEKALCPSHSESNISQERLSPLLSRKSEFQRTDVIRKLSLEEKCSNTDEGRIVRAELVNTIISASPTSPVRPEEKLASVKKDSLMENIEKITQLQSKLMSAHVVENGGGNERKLYGYSAKNLEMNSQQQQQEDEQEQMLVINKTLSTSEEKERKDISNLINSHAMRPISDSLPPSSSTCNENCNSTPSQKCTATPEENNKFPNMNNETDGLKLIQRTEIILRLNAPTAEAASQTDNTLAMDCIPINESCYNENDKDKSMEKGGDTFHTAEADKEEFILAPRKRLQEEIDCDNLTKDLASSLPPTDKLYQVLVPKNVKSSSDYVSCLYRPYIAPKATGSTKRDVGTSTLGSNNNDVSSNRSNGCDPNEKSNTTNSELNTADKNSDKLVETATSKTTPPVERRYCRDNDGNTTLALKGNNENCDLTKKKEELMNRLTKKLQVLNNEQAKLTNEISTNEELGNSLTTKVSEKVRPIDATKFRAYIDDVGHITMLLLSLSGRLARVENALSNLNENHNEQKILETKRDRLIEQLEEAKHLKEDIDRRGNIVAKILQKHLTNEEFANYDYFINIKAKLLVDSREIVDRIKLSEEQLCALKDTLQSEC